jgi:hypothetical protein
MKKLTVASFLSLPFLVSVPALAQLGPAAPVSEFAPVSDQPETLVRQAPDRATWLSGWFVAPTFSTTSFANTLAYSPGLRAGIYINRRVAVGLAINGLGTQESAFDDHLVRNVGSYGGLLLQYVVQSNRLVHVTLESTVGTGQWCALIGDGENGTKDGCDGRKFLAFEPVANVEINVARHVRIATGVGYRFAAAATGNGPSSREMSGLVARTSLVLGSF